MKLRKEHVVAIVVIGAILAALGAVYQFYYQKSLAEYRKNDQRLQQLEGALTKLQQTFEGYQPDVIIKAYRGEVEPLREQVVQRAAFFNTAEFLQVDPIPEGKMLKFYYAEQYNKILNELRQDAMSRTPYIPYPDTSSFGAPRPEEFEGRTPSAVEVRQGLKRLRFGCSVVKMLMDAKAVVIYQVEQWSPRPGYGKLLQLRTMGLYFMMKYSDLVAFLDSLRLADRYFSVEALGIQNRYMRWPVEPPVEVQMLLTQADFSAGGGAPGERPPAAGPVSTLPAAAFPAAPGLTDAQRLAQQGFTRPMQSQQQEPTRWQKFKRWMRNHYLWL